jgi:signal transduction histidine kinase
VLSKHSGTVVCAYETSQCDGPLVMDLLRTHPVVIIGGLIRSNPFFTPTDEFLAALRVRVASIAGSASDPADRQQSLDPGEHQRNLELYERVLAIASHDLGNPLAAVMMGASVLKREPGISAQAVNTASRILVSAQRMRRIIEDLFDLSSARLSGGMKVKLAPMNAHELCARIIEELQVGHPGREIQLLVEGDGNGRWDTDRLEQVVSNLTANALQYGPDEAPVTVESRGSETDWTLSVHNLGEAIPPRALQQVFEPVRRGRNGGSSDGIPHLGIGLFIVRRIVQAHGGTVDVTSEPAEGTRFVVRLPKS